MPKVLLQYQGATLREIPLTKAETTVGRLPVNDIVIDNPAVSSHHCKVMLEGETYFVVDLNSTNGVFVNATKTLKADLHNNDIISIVKHTLKFVDERPKAVRAALARAARAGSSESTVMLAPKPEEPVQTPQKKPAVIRVVAGMVDRTELVLKGRSTYIGKSSHVDIKIKGAGLFASAPENAAMISNNPDGYYLVPVQDKFVKLNGNLVMQKEKLKDGDVIQAGGTTLMFEDKP